MCVVLVSVGSRVAALFLSKGETHMATSEVKASLDNPSQESRQTSAQKSMGHATVQVLNGFRKTLACGIFLSTS